MISKLHSISTAIFVGILLALFVSLGAAAWYSLSVSRTELYGQFEQYRASLTRNVAASMVDPIYSFSPNNGSLVLELVKQDATIVSIEIYDGFNEMDFINFDIPDRHIGNLFDNKEPIIKDGTEIGWAKIVFNDTYLVRQLDERKNLFQHIFGFAFMANVIIMFPLLFFKVFSPLRRLSLQAQQFRRNDLETPFIWKGRDEISLIGQSFERARCAMVELVGELKALSATDRLTGLANRHRLDEVLASGISQCARYGKTLGVILLDVDHFKRVNDTHGHQVGDDVLASVAEILKRNVRESDTVGRWGGEEFLIICPESGTNEIEAVAEKLRQAIERFEFPIVDSMTASFGVAELRPAENVKDLVSRADDALYRAKSGGRNRVETVGGKT